MTHNWYQDHFGNWQCPTCEEPAFLCESNFCTCTTDEEDA